jgi:hypothetical protein
MRNIQTIIWLFIFVVIICSMNVFFGITESFGRRGRGLDKCITQNKNEENGVYFFPRLCLLQEDN